MSKLTFTMCDSCGGFFESIFGHECASGIMAVSMRICRLKRGVTERDSQDVRIVRTNSYKIPLIPSLKDF